MHLCVFLMLLVETIKELASFILKGVDLIDRTSIFLLRIIIYYVILIFCILPWFVPTGTSSEFFPQEYHPHRGGWFDGRYLDFWEQIGKGKKRKILVSPISIYIYETLNVSLVHSIVFKKLYIWSTFDYILIFLVSSIVECSKEYLPLN